VQSAAVPFTSHGNVRNYAEPKQFSWARSACVGFSSSNFTYRALVEMLLELGNLTPAHPHNIPGQVHAVMVTRVNQQPPAHHPLEACYDSVVDEPQLSGHCIAFPLENLSCEEGVL
jgi:hypothetical protein